MKTLVALFLLAAGLSLADAPDATFEVHEWGVFHLPKAGPARAKAGEGLPAFVHKLFAGPPGRTQAKEPVLHVWCPEPMKLEIEIVLPTGGATAYWPPAEHVELRRKAADDPVRTLIWKVEAGPREGGGILPVPEGHWMEAARRAGSRRLRTPSGEAEDFLFYEGHVCYASPAGTEFTGTSVTFAGPGDLEAWALEVTKESVLLARRTGRGEAKLEPVAPKDLRTALLKALKDAGLFEAEAEALLVAWMPELLKEGRRVLHLLPRADYDRLLPIRITPTPDALVRVGLVVKEL